MKKILTIVLALTMVLCLFTACSNSAEEAEGTATDVEAAEVEAAETEEAAETGDLEVVKVGASITPHSEILALCKDAMAEAGYDLQIVEFTDYVQPNNSVEADELLANFFQHKPYMNDFNEQNGTHIVSVADVHYEPFGMYPGKTATIEELADGATITIPNDGTNEARALFLLEAEGLITLKEDVGFTATILDIAENPKNLEIKEIEAAQLPMTIQDVDMAVINGNFAMQGGLSVKNDAVATESVESDAAQTYANILAVKEGNEENPAVLALVEALKSDVVRDYIDATYDGAVVAMF